jgi:hypothetical protein
MKKTKGRKSHDTVPLSKNEEKLKYLVLFSLVKTHLKMH